MKNDKSVKDVVKEYLEANKKDYDGLVEEYGECACLTEDLCPCDDDIRNCRPGYKTECDKELCGEHDWHITAGPRPRADCYKCVHRRTVVGSAHSRCNNIHAKHKGNDHGINQGWFLWPLDFDPTWLEWCDGFSEDPEDNLPEAKFSEMREFLDGIDQMSPRQVFDKVTKGFE